MFLCSYVSKENMFLCLIKIFLCLTQNHTLMDTNKKNLWDKILKVLIAVLSAIAGALGANAMGV